MSTLNPVADDHGLGAMPGQTLDDPTNGGVEESERSGLARWIPLAALVVVVATLGTWTLTRPGGTTTAFRLSSVERGDVASSVTATGTLNPVTQVEVGTQVSGQISGIYADFNDHVTEGQLIARIDPTLLEQAVRDAEAGLERSQAALVKAQREYDRSKQLFERQVLTETEFNDAEYALSVAEADAKSAQVALDRAQRNLSYTSIYAPIDGVVVERNVDVGQTVAANFSAPQLFLIAQDLGEMEILAAVDESDIGEISAGQAVTFTVQAYPDTTFTGTVRQVRLQSTTTENIVNYTAVVTVSNPAGKLLPGMTATASFLTGSASDVLLVPNGALRYQPSDAALASAELGPSAQAEMNRPPSPTEAPVAETGQQGGFGGPPPPGGGTSATRSSSTSRPEETGTIWYVDDAGRLEVAHVRVGVSDGRRTEVSGEGLVAGMGVIVGTGSSSSRESQVSSPFQSERQAGPPRPGF